MIRDTQDFTIHVGECRAWWTQSNSILDRKKFSPKLIFNEGWRDKRKKKKLNPGTRDPTNSSPSVSLAKLCIESHRVVLESSENESLRPRVVSIHIPFEGREWKGCIAKKEACRWAGFPIFTVLIVSTQQRHMCGKRLAIHANSFRKFNRRIRPRCAVWSSFVRSWCEQPRDKDRKRERKRRRRRKGRGQGRPETKDRIEEKERKMSGQGIVVGVEGECQRARENRNAKRVGNQGLNVCRGEWRGEERRERKTRA